MKKILQITCIIAAIFSIGFPIYYFHGYEDVKEIKISHILVDSQEEASNILEEIKRGFNFATAAEKYSKDERTNKARGDLGYNGKYNLLVPEVSEAAFKLKRYEVSEPIKSEYGWHIIKVFDIVYFSDRKNFDERYIYTWNKRKTH